MKPKQSNLTIFAILTTITIFTWVFVEAYQRFYKIELATIPLNVISPLNPTLDSPTLESIKKKIQLTETDLSSLTPEINPEPTPESTISAQIPEPETTVATQEATISATPTP